MSSNAGSSAPARRSSIQNFIVGWLSRYIDGLQDGQAKIEHDLWNGEMTIVNAKLNTAALSKYMRSANLTEGSVGRIRIKVPWSTLLSASTTVEVDEVKVELSSLGFADRLAKAGGSLEALRATLLQDKRDLIDNLVRAMELKRQLDSEEVGTFTGTLLAAMINSIQISIKDVCVSFRVNGSVITLSLGEASVLSCNKDWQVGAETAVAGEWFKRCELSKLRIDVGVDSPSKSIPLQAEPLDATLLISSTQQNRAMHCSLKVNGGKVTIDRERANIMLKVNRTLHSEGKLVRQALSSNIKEGDKDVLKAEYQALLANESNESDRIDNIEALVPAVDLARWRYERGLTLKRKESEGDQKAQVTSWFASWAGKDEVDKVVGNAAKGADTGRKMQRSVTWSFELTNVTVDCLQHDREETTPPALGFGLGRLFFNIVIPNLSSPQEFAVDGGVDDVQIEAFGKQLMSFDSRPDGPSVEVSLTRSKSRGKGILDPYEATVSVTSDALVAWIEPEILKRFAASAAQFASEYKEAKVSAITDIQETASKLDMSELTDIIQSASQRSATKLVSLKVDVMAPIIHVKPAEESDELTCILGRVQVSSKDGEEYRISMSDNSVVVAGKFGCTQFLDPSEVHIVVQRKPIVNVKIEVPSVVCLRLTPACLRFVNGTLKTVKELVKEIVGSMKDMRRGIKEAVERAKALPPPPAISVPQFGLELVLDTARLEICADAQTDGLLVQVENVSLARDDKQWKGACGAFSVHADGEGPTPGENCAGCITLQGESSSGAVELKYADRILDIQSGYLLSDITPGFLRIVTEVSRELSAEVEGVDPDDAREATRTVMEASDALFSSKENAGEEEQQASATELERVKLGLLEFARRNGGSLGIPKMDSGEELIKITIGSRGSCLSLFNTDDTRNRSNAVVIGRIADLGSSISILQDNEKGKLTASGEVTVRSISLEVAGEEIISPALNSHASVKAAPFVSILWGLYPSPWPYHSAVIAQAQQLRIRPLLANVEALIALGKTYKEATKPEEAPPVEKLINQIDDLGAAIGESAKIVRLPCLIAVRVAAPIVELAVPEKKDDKPHTGAVDLMDLDAQEQSSEESYELGDRVLLNLGVVTLDSKLLDDSTVQIDASVKNVSASAFCLPPATSLIGSNGSQVGQEDLLVGSEQETDTEPALKEEIILPCGSVALSLTLPLSWEKLDDEEEFSKLVSVDVTVQDRVAVSISPEALVVMREVGKCVKNMFGDSDITDIDAVDQERVLAGLQRLATKRKRTDVQIRGNLEEASLSLVTHEGGHPLEVSLKSLAFSSSRRTMQAELQLGEASAKVANFTFIHLLTRDERAGLVATCCLDGAPKVRLISPQGVEISLSSAIEEGLRTISKACSLSDSKDDHPKSHRSPTRWLRFLPQVNLQLHGIGLNLYSQAGACVRAGIDLDCEAFQEKVVNQQQQPLAGDEQDTATPTIIDLTGALKLTSLTSKRASSDSATPRRILKNREGTLVTVEGKIVNVPGEKLSLLLDTVRFENALAISLSGPDVTGIRSIMKELSCGMKKSTRPRSEVFEVSIAVFFAPRAHILIELVYCSASGLSRPAIRVRLGTKLLSLYYQQWAKLTAGSSRQPPVFKILAADVTTRASVINYKMGEWEPLLLPLTTNVEVQRMTDREDPEGRIIRVDMRASPEASNSDLIVSPMCLGVLHDLLPQFSSKKGPAVVSSRVDESSNDALMVVNLTGSPLVVLGDNGVRETIQPGPKHVGIDHLLKSSTTERITIEGESPGTAQLLHENELSLAQNGNWQAEVVALSPIRKLLVFSGPVRIANMTRIPLRVYLQSHVSDTGEPEVIAPTSLTTSVGDVVCDQEGYFLLEPRAFIGVPSSVFHTGGGFSIQPDDGNWERSEPLPCTFSVGGTSPRTRRLKMSCRNFANPDELMYVNCQYSPVHGTALDGSSSSEEDSATDSVSVTSECPMNVELEVDTASQAREPHVLRIGPSGSGALPIFDIDASFVRVRVPGSSSRGTHWGRPIFIDDEADLNVVQTIDLPVVNGAGTSLSVSAVVTSDPDGCQQLTLFSKNWFVNSVEGLDVYPMQQGVNDLVRSPSLASDKDLYHMAPVEDRKKGGLSLTIGFVDNQSPERQGAQWRRVLVPLSSRDSCELELGGSSVVLQADVVEKEIEDDSSKMPESGVMIPVRDTLPINLVRSTVITAVPGIIMFNRTSKCLKVSQLNLKGTLLGPMENSPVHWADLRRDRLLQIVYADPSTGETSGWEPTGPIIPREANAGVYSMILRNKFTQEVSVLTVEVAVTRGVVNVAIYEADGDTSDKGEQKPCLQVLNDKCYHIESILVCPEDDPTQTSFTYIPADSIKSVGFCDPFRTKHYLLVRVEFEKNVSSLYRIDADDCPSSMPITKKGFPATTLQILPSPSCEGGVMIRLRPYNPSLHLAAFDKTGDHSEDDATTESDTAWSLKLELAKFGVRVFGPGSKARRIRQKREELFYCGVSRSSLIASCGVEGGADHADTLVLRSFRMSGIQFEHVPRNLRILSTGSHSKSSPGLGLSGIRLNARHGRDLNLRDVCLTVPPMTLTLDTRVLDDLTALIGAFVSALGSSGGGLSSLTISSAAARAGVPYHYLCTTPAQLGRVLKLQRLTVSQISLKLWCSFDIDDSQFLPDDIKFLLSLLTLGDTLDLKGSELVLPQQAFNMYQPYRGPASGLSKILSDEYKKVIVANISQVVGSSSVLNVIGAKLWGQGFASGSDSDEEKRRMFAGGNGTRDSRHGVELRGDGVLQWEDKSLDESQM
ncbi:vacuolar protein [Perkinsus chesapeaki]|uniref:Vacuolar protein n=1 Tax=Perkinsus chesapeaki TaxID=330153 RepID=A0A7J6MTQ8_PERCH|nr:vacuolar protein [Perkinsus chesapeaki]